MQRKIAVIISMFLSFSVQMYATGYPVFDAANWLSAIDRFYQGYDQIMNTLQMIEQNYQQIQHAIEQAKSWKFEDLDFNDGNVLENIDIRDEIQDATKQVNRQLNNIRQMRDTFNNQNMTIGNKTFSMKDLAGLGDKDKTLIDIVKEGISMEVNDFKEAYKNLSKDFTDDEKKAIWSKYGLNTENFLMVKDLDKKFREQAETVMANADAKVQAIQEGTRTARMNNIINKIFEGDELTEKELAQAEVLLQHLQGEEFAKLKNALENSFAYLAWKDRRDEQLEEAKQEQIRARIEKDVEKDEGCSFF